jgi:hypothetical protein
MACGLQASMGLGSGRTSASNPNQGQGPGDGSDVWAGNYGNVPRNKDARDIKASEVPVMATGERRETGDETYIEVRGPASLGARSSVPYLKALPKYQKRAEEAIARKRIPKSKQKRVKEYFDSLQRGKK